MVMFLGTGLPSSSAEHSAERVLCHREQSGLDHSLGSWLPKQVDGDLPDVIGAHEVRQVWVVRRASAAHREIGGDSARAEHLTPHALRPELVIEGADEADLSELG